jgi:hypothetical protein
MTSILLHYDPVWFRLVRVRNWADYSRESAAESVQLLGLLITRPPEQSFRADLQIKYVDILPGR